MERERNPSDTSRKMLGFIAIALFESLRHPSL